MTLDPTQCYYYYGVLCKMCIIQSALCMHYILSILCWSILPESVSLWSEQQLVTVFKPVSPRFRRMCKPRLLDSKQLVYLDTSKPRITFLLIMSPCVVYFLYLFFTQRASHIFDAIFIHQRVLMQPFVWMYSGLCNVYCQFNHLRLPVSDFHLVPN